MGRIAIIPARGGSKRIPQKNTKPFLGKPIICYSIEAANACGLFDEVMVSTDDKNIAGIAKEAGATVPHLRSQKNSDDYAPLADVIREVLEMYNGEGKTFEKFCCILPTAPFITGEILTKSFEKLTLLQLDSVCALTEFSYPILRALKLSDDARLSMIWPEYMQTRSQDLEPAYHDAGMFYWVETQAFHKERQLFCKNGSGIIIPETEVQDIDTETDWKLAELKYKLRYG